MRHRPLLLLTGGALAALGLWLSTGGGGSVAQAPGAKLILYWEPDFQGPSLEVTGTLLDMPVVTDDQGGTFDWNDQVRSLVVVSGAWRIWQHGRAGTRLDDTPLEALDVSTKEPAEGWSCLFSATSSGPLRIASCALGGFAHDVSAIELVSEENLPDWGVPRR